MKKTRGLLIGFCLLIGVLISSGASAGIKAEVPAEPAQGSPDLGIAGEWQGNTGIRYTIRQDGATFTWWAAALHEKATGTVHGRELNASWQGDNGSHSATGRITSDDGSGRATRIEFSNGAVFTRLQAPPQEAVIVGGEWQGNTGIRYTIRQEGASFTWWAEAIHERATGTIRGRELSASWQGDNGSHSVTGRITSEDGSGRATRIEFSNGAVFTRLWRI